jgi:Na+-transporting NADH:ubiquinone oxidoreductase subunit E
MNPDILATLTTALTATLTHAVATLTGPEISTAADLPVEPVVNSARLLTIFFASLLTNNIALTYFLGMCAFLSLSKKMKVAVGMGIAVVLVMVLTAAVNWVIHVTVLVPLGLDFFQFLVFILVIAAIVQVLELIIDRHFPTLYHAFGLFLPLIAVNCAILGASLFMILREYGFLETVVFALGSGLGWMLAIVSLTGLRRHLVFSSPPANLGPVGSAIILAGIMAMGFAGFSGMVRL